jgi:20S proteasome subunit beta 7
MIPRRVAHNPIIGPGVVPRGVDAEYDAACARDDARDGPATTTHAPASGRAFTLDGKAR